MAFVFGVDKFQNIINFIYVGQNVLYHDEIQGSASIGLANGQMLSRLSTC